MMMTTRQSLPFVEIISNSCNNILLLLLPCNYVSFILHLFTSTSRLFVNKGLIFVIAGTRKNAGRKAAATTGDHLGLPEGPLTHRRRGATVGGAFAEQGEEAPRTSLGDEEVGVASRPDAQQGVTTTTTGSSSSSSDSDHGGEATPGETPSLGSSKVYSRGPSSLPSAPLAPSHRPVIRPCGDK